MAEAPALLEVRRGGLPEAVHFGHVAVADADGNLFASAGEPGFVTFLRSTAKPIQALPVIESGAAERFAVTPVTAQAAVQNRALRQRSPPSRTQPA